MRFRFPWDRRMDEARANTEKAQNEYEWAVQQRTTVQDVIKKIVTHGTDNGLIEKLNLAVRGHK